MPTYSHEVPYSFGIYKHIVSGWDTDHFAVLVIMRVWVIAVRVQIFVPCFGTDAFGGYVYTCTVCVYVCICVCIYTYTTTTTPTTTTTTITICIYNVCSVLPI